MHSSKFWKFTNYCRNRLHIPAPQACHSGPGAFAWHLPNLLLAPPAYQSSSQSENCCSRCKSICSLVFGVTPGLRILALVTKACVSCGSSDLGDNEQIYGSNVGKQMWPLLIESISLSQIMHLQWEPNFMLKTTQRYEEWTLSWSWYITTRGWIKADLFILLPHHF